ncbi:MAG: CPBP family intramembrane metalloprotease [Candidatus Melainabacteria bacterium]|jgi:membrane protease YdiL (CAAX protease family)|nr:CPBP family intramembrane metalloprotease [Candidatus Melainabacteria bacterium]
MSGRFINLWNWIFKPQVRLEANFPWTLGKSLKTYGIASLIYLIGTTLPMMLLSLVFRSVLSAYPELFANLSEQGFLLIIVVMALVCFICGFAAEVWYIRRRLKLEKFSFKKTLALNLDSLNGSRWAVVWRALLAFAWIVVLTQVVERLLPVSHVVDPAADFARSLSGVPALLFVFLGVIVAPIVEEIVFRGFLYNAVRTSFRSDKAMAFFGSKGWGDLAAAFTSALVFGLFHMNFMQFPALNWAALPIYTVTGMVMSESYRRSGSLYVPILVHAFNNLTVMALTYLVA